MEELFRFTVARPPERKRVLTLAIDQQSPFVETLRHQEGWPGMFSAAQTYLDSRSAIIDLTSVPLCPQLARFLEQLHAVPPPSCLHDLAELAGLLLATDSRVQLNSLWIRLVDNFLALYVAPNRDRPSLIEIADLLRVIKLVQRIAANDTALNAADSVPISLAITLELPPFFKVPAGRVRPVGIADLLVVKQHIVGYELGEIARIENVLKGESRKHTQRHRLVNERSTTIETDTTTEKVEELTSADKVNIKNEVDTTLKEDFNLKTGVSLGLSGSGYEFKSNFDAAYDRSSSQSAKFASDVAKDVTRRASAKVTERVRQVQTTKITETFDEVEVQGFENKSGDNTSGIYQWLEKVYEAQVFNYGKHLLFDLMVPEPAAFVLQAAKLNEQNPSLTPPPALNFSPLDISESDSNSDFYYPKLVLKYLVSGVEPPPAQNIALAKAVATSEAGEGDVQVSDTMDIPDGYQADTFDINVSYYQRGGAAPNFQLSIGDIALHFDDKGVDGVNNWGNEHQRTAKGNKLQDGKGVTGHLGVTIQTAFVSRASANLEVYCSRTNDGLNKWKLETYEKIAARYEKLKADYDEQMASQQFQETSPALLGRDPDTNRLIERTELKKSCISILVGNALAGTNDVTGEADPPDPAIKVPESLHDGPWVRFFEQAFEWDKIGYVFYPYYWGRPKWWHDKLDVINSDPLFENFLKAGYSRVVVPVRKNFENAIIYFLISGKIWQGGALPDVTDPTYLPITEEIKEQTQAPDGGIPVGTPWNFRLPTTLLRLRADGKSPMWTQPDTAKWEWVPKSREWEPLT